MPIPTLIDLSKFNATQSISLDLSNNYAWQTVTPGVLTLFISSSTGIENVLTGAGDDTVTGNSRDNLIVTDGGNDVIYGGDGNDSLFGGDGNDVIHGGAGNDMLYGDYGNDQLYGEADDDHLEGSAGDDALYGGDGNDVYVFQWSPGPGTISLGSDTIYESSTGGTNDQLDFSNFNNLDYTAPALGLSGTTIVSRTQISDPTGGTSTPVMRDLLWVTIDAASTVESILAPPTPENDPHFDVDSGALFVTATDANDSITFSTDASGVVHVFNNGDEQMFDHVAHADQVVSISVTTGAGDDKIDLSSVTASEYSSLEFVSIDGGDGDDQIIGTQWSSSVPAGDINRDGQVNGSDIAAFLNAITDIPDWKSQ